MDFVFPSESSRADVLSFYREFEESGGSCIGYGDGAYKEYNMWLTGMQNRKTGKNLPQGYVRENFYLCYEKGKMVGVYSFKFELTEYLLNYGGHIGYAVRPSERKKGYATVILEKGLQIAKESGFQKVLLVCDADNAASEKVILKNGGVLENTLFAPEENVLVKRYWISL